MHSNEKSFGSTEVGVNFKDILQFFKIVHKEIIPHFPYENFSLPTQNFENSLFRIFEFLKLPKLIFQKHAHAKRCLIN